MTYRDKFLKEEPDMKVLDIDPITFNQHQLFFIHMQKDYRFGALGNFDKYYRSRTKEQVDQPEKYLVGRSGSHYKNEILKEEGVYLESTTDPVFPEEVLNFSIFVVEMLRHFRRLKNYEIADLQQDFGILEWSWLNYESAHTQGVSWIMQVLDEDIKKYLETGEREHMKEEYWVYGPGKGLRNRDRTQRLKIKKLLEHID